MDTFPSTAMEPSKWFEKTLMSVHIDAFVVAATIFLQAYRSNALKSTYLMNKRFVTVAVANYIE